MKYVGSIVCTISLEFPFHFQTVWHQGRPLAGERHNRGAVFESGRR
jgi:hypothetical protein